jgi:hypothetical protein
MTTIRQHLAQQAKSRYWTVAAGVVFIGVLVFTQHHLHLARPVAMGYIFAGGLLMTGVFFIVDRGARCPRCKASLAGAGGRLNFCPNCGANFDEQMPP